MRRGEGAKVERLPHRANVGKVPKRQFDVESPKLGLNDGGVEIEIVGHGNGVAHFVRKPGKDFLAGLTVLFGHGLGYAVNFCGLVGNDKAFGFKYKRRRRFQFGSRFVAHFPVDLYDSWPKFNVFNGRIGSGRDARGFGVEKNISVQSLYSIVSTGVKLWKKKTHAHFLIVADDKKSLILPE